MTDECIHGLPIDRCDICTPKTRPAPSTSATRAPRARATRSGRSGEATPRRTAGAASKTKPVILSEQRVHHLTHVDNLTGMLVDGVLHADAATSWDARPEIDISSPDTREARRAAMIAGTAGTVADYVPFFLSPDANVWAGMRADTPDPRLTRAARTLPSAEFVMLVTTFARIAPQDLPYPIVADGDAADARTRFAATQEDAERSLRRMLTSDDGMALRAEVLVHDSVPFEAITLIGVAHEKARASVRSILAGSRFQPRVAVHPPWFAVPTAE